MMVNGLKTQTISFCVSASVSSFSILFYDGNWFKTQTISFCVSVPVLSLIKYPILPSSSGIVLLRTTVPGMALSCAIIHEYTTLPMSRLTRKLNRKQKEQITIWMAPGPWHLSTRKQGLVRATQNANRQDLLCCFLLFLSIRSPKISRTNLAYFRFAFANEQEEKIGRKSENQQDKSCLLPVCVRK